MSDGPLKNLKLGSCLRPVADAVQNNAASSQECGAVASHALARHLVTEEHVKLLRGLDAHLGCGRLELDPLGSVQAIFDRCDKTPFLDVLQKEISYRVANNTPLGDSITPALDAAVGAQIGETRNRFHEEIIRVQESGEISRTAAELVHSRIEAAFNAVECTKIRDALLAGNRDAFEKDIFGDNSVDEGIACL